MVVELEWQDRLSSDDDDHGERFISSIYIGVFRTSLYKLWNQSVFFIGFSHLLHSRGIAAAGHRCRLSLRNRQHQAPS